MKVKPKVLIIENALSTTGAFKSILAVADALKSDVSFSFALPRQSQVVNQLAEHGFGVIQIPFLEIRKSLSVLLYLPMLIINSMRLASYTRRAGIDLVHVNDLYNLTGVGIKLLRPGIRLFYHVRLLPDSYASALYPVWRAIILCFSDRVICNSRATRAGIHRNDSKVSIIYDPPPHQVPYNVNKSTEQITLLYLANYTKGKGHEYAIEAFARAKEKLPQLRMIMVGGTLGLPANEAFKISLERLAHERGISANIEFRGFEKDIQALMNEATIFLNFSESESFSITCFEALYFGVPVIATDSGGPQEFILDGNTGYIVRRGDIGQMADRILALASDEKKRLKFIVNGRHLISNRFDRDVILSDYRRLYKVQAGYTLTMKSINLLRTL